MTHRTHAVAKTRAHQVRWSSRCRSRTAGAGARAAAGARGAAAAGRGRTTQLRLSSASTLVDGSPQLQRSSHALLRPQESKSSRTHAPIINGDGTVRHHPSDGTPSWGSRPKLLAGESLLPSPRGGRVFEYCRPLGDASENVQVGPAKISTAQDTCRTLKITGERRKRENARSYVHTHAETSLAAFLPSIPARGSRRPYYTWITFHVR